MGNPCLDISDLIPQRGAMCLLDSIDSWDEAHIVCRSTSHRRPDNPLRDDSGLRAICAIEYGAQAIAAHAALLGQPGNGNIGGVLAAIRDLTTACSHLDDISGPLTIRADVVLLRDSGRIYDLLVTSGERPLVSGRLSVAWSREVGDSTLPAWPKGLS
jgi:predicted hotdog family 3-hydroxylacyl-ACP dehydratase